MANAHRAPADSLPASQGMPVVHEAYEQSPTFLHDAHLLTGFSTSTARGCLRGR
jgi:hypothetical protein